LRIEVHQAQELRGDVTAHRQAEDSKKSGKKKTGSRTITREWGKRKRYAPMTPAMAPEAPTVGTVESGFVRQCTIPAARPASR
jgi:hypothetical protein